MVAGLNYFLTVTVKDASGQVFDMDMTVWSRPWLEVGVCTCAQCRPLLLRTCNKWAGTSDAREAVAGVESGCFVHGSG